MSAIGGGGRVLDRALHQVSALGLALDRVRDLDAALERAYQMSRRHRISCRRRHGSAPGDSDFEPLDCAFVQAIVAERSRELARAQNAARTQALGLVRQLTTIRWYANDVGRGLDPRRVAALDRTLLCARNLMSDLARDRHLDLLRTLAVDLRGEVDRDLGTSQNNDRVFAVDLLRDLVRDYVPSLFDALSHGGETADGSREHAVSPANHELADGTFRTPVVRVSLRLASCAVWLLPAAYQADYEELFESELFDIAVAGNGWWSQVAYSVRVLARAPMLRRALRASAPPMRERA